NSQRQRQAIARLPHVVGENAVRFGGSVPVPQNRLSTQRSVGHGGLGGRSVLNQIQQAVEIEGRLGVRTLEVLHIVAKPSRIPELQGMGAADVRQHVAPVIV